MSYDIVIRNTRIIDGAGNPWFKGDIGVKGDRISKIGLLSDIEAVLVIDAEGLISSPGFIDAHSHSDSISLAYREMENVIHQGITTVVAGQCGASLAPITDLNRLEMQRELNEEMPLGFEIDVNWSNFDDYLRQEEKEGLGANIAHLVGHGTIRAASMGFDARAPSDKELEKMKEYTAEAMEAGAFGLSTGLIYPPGIFAETDEIIELAKVVSDYGGVYDSHIRGEGENLLKSLDEAIKIGVTTGIPVQISHHKIMSKKLWGSNETLRKFEKARGEGVDITFDQYPYRAGSTSLMTVLPPWVHDGGKEKALERLRDTKLRRKMLQDIIEGLPGWENFAGELGWRNVYVSSVKTSKNKELEGKNLEEIKEIRGDDDEFTSLYKLLLEEDGSPGMIIFFGDEEDVQKIMKHPLQMVGTDSGTTTVSGPFSRGKPHPRHYGTYPKILESYVRKEKVLRLETAIRKMTSFPAQRFGLLNRGLLKPGMKADITIFDPKEVQDNSSYQSPHQFPSGIPYVIVNGKIVLDREEYTGIKAGKTLRKEN